MEDILQFLRENGQSVFLNCGISVATVAHEKSGIDLVLPLLEEQIDRQTVLYLSGGRTPKALYSRIADSESLYPGSFAMVDERYGQPMHADSNEKMLMDTGLLRYAQMRSIPFHKILRGEERAGTADAYDQDVRTLLAQYQSHIAILGVGMDGHTAGIPAVESLGVTGEKRTHFVEDLKERSRSRMVIDYDDTGGFYKERITMTYAGLSMMDVFLVLVFGQDKKKALELMLSDGSEEDVPSRYFVHPDIAKKTLLIIDQMI